MFNFFRARKQGQGQVLFNKNNKAQVRVMVKVFVSEELFCLGDLGVWLKLPF